MTEKITKLTKSNSSVYIEASEVRKLKAIDESGREHEVRERKMEDEARGAIQLKFNRLRCIKAFKYRLDRLQ